MEMKDRCGDLIIVTAEMLPPAVSIVFSDKHEDMDMYLTVKQSKHLRKMLKAAEKEAMLRY